MINNRVEAVLARVRPNLIGDGILTVEELIDEKIKLRKQNPDLYSRPLLIDDILHSHLQSHGLTMKSIPDRNSKVILRGNANISTGGETVDITEHVQSEIKEVVEKAVNSIPNLATCAVDVMCKDINNISDLSNVNLIINEIESDPGMCIHHFPFKGKPRNLAGILLSNYFGVESDRIENYQHDFDENEVLVNSIIFGLKNHYFDFFEKNITY